MKPKWNALWLVILAAGAAPSASAGDKTGNAGEEVQQDFIIHATSGAQLLESRIREYPGVDVAMIRSLLELEGVVEPTDEVLLGLDGQPKTAINLPGKKPRIRVNIARWNRIGKDRRRKMALALHEFLGLEGSEVGNYRITSKLFGISEAQLAYGRIATLKLGAGGYQYVAVGRQGGCRLQVSVDLENLTIVQTKVAALPGPCPHAGDSEVFLCADETAQQCSGVSPAPQPPAVREMSVLADGGFFSRYRYLDGGTGATHDVTRYYELVRKTETFPSRASGTQGFRLSLPRDLIEREIYPVALKAAKKRAETLAIEACVDAENPSCGIVSNFGFGCKAHYPDRDLPYAECFALAVARPSTQLTPAARTE